MYYSHNHNLLFARIPKNASTSMQAYFISNCEKNITKDVYSGLGEILQLENSPTYPHEVAQRWLTFSRYHHLTLEEMVQENLLTEEQVLNANVLGIVREPLYRTLSFFLWDAEIGVFKDGSPERFRYHHQQGYDSVKAKYNASPGPCDVELRQSDWLMYKGEMLGEFWAAEDIPKRLPAFAEKVGIKETYPLLKLKSHSKYTQGKTKQELIDEYYDDATLKAVTEYYATDFELYNRVKMK